MDTSKEYIKMCETAQEIQDLWQAKIAKEVGGFITNGNQVNQSEFWVATRVFWNESDFVVHRDLIDKYFWLPRQDQLQKMVINLLKNLVGLDYRGEKSRHIDLYWAFRYWFEKKAGEDYIRSLFSMEQLWLAFVMQEKHHRTWDGEQWILQKNI